MTNKKLLIVESPTKAKSISKMLKDFKVIASVGHIKDLPKKELGVDIENDFKPKYITIKGKGKVIKELKESAKKADEIYIATDPDREGEAIAQHIAEVVGEKKNPKRVLFYEITPKGIKEGLKSPRKVNNNLVMSQQARRVLDRLVGYKISPVLWKVITRGLSAGRVQSVALKLLCEKEKKIQSFKPEEYWIVKALLEKGSLFTAVLEKKAGKKYKPSSQKEAEQLKKTLLSGEFKVKKFVQKNRKQSPLPPYITSTLEQDASRFLGFTPKKTMMIAQQLFEGIEIDGNPTGLITYMRTDSVRLSDDAISMCRDYIKNVFPKEYLPSKKKVYKSSSSAQGAHEAIRPTNVDIEPEKIKNILTRDQYRLYRIIWNRFVACQMADAVYSDRIVDIKNGEYLFKAKKSVNIFDGYMRIYKYKDTEEEEKKDKAEEEIPELKEGDILNCEDILLKQEFTKPPARYTEASLIKDLESKGVGRPSTYATIISTLYDRKYIERVENRKIKPTDLGMTVNDFLEKYFNNIINIKFTANMETELDKIENGETDYLTVVKDLYEPLNERLEKIDTKKMKETLQKEMNENNGGTKYICELCGRPMIIKWGRYGKFLACSGYPECKNTKPLPEDEEKIEEKCPECGGDLVVKQSRYGKFIGCSNYPKCKFTKSYSIGIKCPDCEGDIVERRDKRGRIYYACSNAECKIYFRSKPIERKCSKCGYPLMEEQGKYYKCPKCGYREKKAE